MYVTLAKELLTVAIILLFPASCSEQHSQSLLESLSQCHSHHTNSTAVIQNGQQLILSINDELGSVHHQQVVWRHNGHLLDTSRDPRLIFRSNGDLVINLVRPSDAGCYFVIFTGVSQCGIAHFNVFLECM